MSEAWEYMSAYQKLTDGVLDYIMMSNEKGLETSKNLLSRIHNRDLYQCVYESPPEMVFISICLFWNWWNRNANNADVITMEILKKYFIFFLSVITTVSFYGFDIWVWNCPDGAVCFAFHFSITRISI